MTHNIFQLALVVRDYDEAIAFYTDKLGFIILEDTRLSAEKRWVRIAPDGSGCSLLLAEAANEQQLASVGNQTGGRVFLFMHTDDIQRDFTAMQARGVSFVGEPREEEFGTVVVFVDLYGNKWDLIQPRSLLD